MTTRADDLPVKRLKWFARVCFFWGLVVAARLFQVQVLEHHEYVRQAHRQQDRRIEIAAPRGTIYDRNGGTLAISVPVESVCVNPLRIKDPVHAARLLGTALHVDVGTLYQEITDAAAQGRGFLWVKRKASEQEIAALKAFKLDWMEFRPESTRIYPRGTLAAHVLGGVDFEERGNAGIEQSFDKGLRGEPGVVLATADVRHSVFEKHIVRDPVPGESLTLTIDERIQNDAEKALAKAVPAADASFGSVVVMNPQNGEILALANYPTYDPNVPPKSRKEFEATRKNLAVMASFEPGSVFKVITLAAALETTRLTPQSSFYCNNGAFTLFGRRIRDAKPHGFLTFSEILQKSSNIGAIKIALEVGPHKLHEYVRKFGFGRRPGLPLPGEDAGLLWPYNPRIPSSIGSIAMGHELTSTTVQLARACSVIANGGFLLKPRIVRARSRPGEPARDEPPSERVRIIRAETANTMRAIMRDVVEEGTGKRAQLFAHWAGGKTGSAQVWDRKAGYTHRYNGSFMGFTPVNNPALVIVVTLNNTRTGNAGFGGVVAAPVFKEVAEPALRYLDVPGDLPEGLHKRPTTEMPEPDLAIAGLGRPPAEELILAETPAPEPEPEITNVLYTGPKVPDFHGKTKREVLSDSAAAGVRVELAGMGIATAQDPAPGTILRPGQRVKVQFAR